jgi:hypothetical protein
MAFFETYKDEFPKQAGHFIPDTALYLGFIARAEVQTPTNGGALYVKKIKYTSLADLKAQCTASALTGKVFDSVFIAKSSTNNAEVPAFISSVLISSGNQTAADFYEVIRPKVDIPYCKGVSNNYIVEASTPNVIVQSMSCR